MCRLSPEGMRHGTGRCLTGEGQPATEPRQRGDVNLQEVYGEAMRRMIDDSRNGAKAHADR